MSAMRVWAVLVIGLLMAAAICPVLGDEPATEAGGCECQCTASGDNGSGEPQPSLPKTLDELKARHETLGKAPQGAVKLFLDACFVYMNAETRGEGRKMIQYLAIPLKSTPDWDKKAPNKLFVERLTKPEFAHIWRSYAIGTSPENAYQMDPNSWELNFLRVFKHDDDDRGTQVYLRSSGADSPRVVYAKQSASSGLWYLNIWHTLFVGIRPPVDTSVEAFE